MITLNQISPNRIATLIAGCFLVSICSAEIAESGPVAVREAGEAQVAEGKDDARFPIYPQHLVAKIRAAMPDDGMICLDIL